MEQFSGPTRAWFERALGEPTKVQREAWDAISRGENALVIAPTGSGKTLAAFLWAIDRLLAEPRPAAPARPATRVLYISPLKALGVDVERNLRAPLRGISDETLASGGAPAEVRVGVRSGDTTPAGRRALLTTPPDILITTPESLFLMLTSSACATLAEVGTVIVDEVHAVAGTKRGAHLAVSLERLDDLLASPAQRVGLSATVEPPEEVARFLGGARPVTIVRPASHKRWDLSVEVPVRDMADLTRDQPSDDPRRQHSIWPHIDERVLDEILAHRSTLVFANSRRTAEQVTNRLNALHAARAEEAGEAPPANPLARAHHGSISKEQRAQIEDALKRGELRCVVATSSLELGIDMGDIDLVIQLAAPFSVASGLQRIGRAGHHVGAASEGIIFPTHRADLVAATVVADRMLAGAVESTRTVANPLDILAQHTVSACALGSLAVDDWWHTLRRSAPFADLPRDAFDATLDLLAGRYPSDAFSELRPRIVWDREAATITGRPGGQRLAVTNAGTIPDRGLFPVFLAAGDETRGPRRVGELDEEMVFESRVGDVIALGASSWRIDEITPERVSVTPAPGQQGRMPFWHGEDDGRPAVLGDAIGEFLRVQSTAPDDAPLEALGLSPSAIRNLRSYLADQRRATGLVPHDRQVVVERFKDGFDDWQLVCHSPFGKRINAPWALAVAQRIRELHGIDPQVMAADDGIVVRLVDADGIVPDADIFRFDPDEIERRVTAQARHSSLFASRFRECAGRALMLPNRTPGRRSPLWQQRLRSAQLLQVASRHPDFPIVLEALREVLMDAYDLPALRALHERMARGVVALQAVETAAPSPFAQQLLMQYIGQFMYDGDAPLAERKAAVLALDHHLLAQLLGQPDLHDVLDPEVIARVGRELQRSVEHRRARDVEGVADLLRLLGPLSDDDLAARVMDPPRAADWADELVSAGRAVRLTLRGRTVTAAVEDASRLRDALGVTLPDDLPQLWRAPVDDPLGDVVARFARTHAPFTADEAAAALGLGVAVVRQELDRLIARAEVVVGRFSAPIDQYVEVGVLRTIRARSLAGLRAEVQLVDGERYASLLLALHHVTPETRVHGEDGLLDVVDQLAGVRLPASAVLPLVLAARCDDAPAALERLVAQGEVLWTGAGTLAGGDGWLKLHLAESAALTLPDEAALREAEQPLDDNARRILGALRERGGAHTVADLAAATGLTPSQADDALASLAWAGLVTSDTFQSVRALVDRPVLKAPTAPQPLRSRRGRLRIPRSVVPRTLPGRWTAVRHEPVDPTVLATETAQLLLDRHGVLTRGAVEREEIPGGFPAVYRVLSALEDHGRCRRGYFVEHLGPAQFAEAATVDELRAERPSSTVLLAATDPANPYGAALDWPTPLGPDDAPQAPARRAGAAVVLTGGRLVAYLEQGGRTLMLFADDHLAAAAGALSDAVRRGALPDLSLELIAGEAAGSPSGLAREFADALRALGAYPTPKALRLRR
ncbi:MAG: ATP-dependent helicase [Propionibacteriaceae bacterium]|nr:ATP-dependent helicase [Propionibacteriaceae bacterium]